ncbi:isochorismate synthase [Flavobacterium agrisoli]|uniref:isochorismate synthase n=1 Tax=Flavobacterium agrisoli TaxID=2793066 RepID=A0A934PLI0_9FLAO|nr:isochorismate synthase [Flavobacterium agrisoli]MBK0369034.1 isochorismate synthase [Flavobacterium agrisoli]
MIHFFDKIKQHKSQNLPFVMYSKPSSESVFALLQSNATLCKVEDFTEKGFVFASFDGSQAFLIPQSLSEIIQTTFECKSISSTQQLPVLYEKETQANFENLVQSGIEAIKKGEFKKVVLSREEVIELPNFDFISFFEDLLSLYQSTFVYCFFHPEIGFWMGATPEQLLQVNQHTFETTALAGTQKEAGLDSEIVWQQKEKEEQQYVTDFILKKLKKVATDVVVSQPYSLKAGAIWHIKTDISGKMNSNSSIKDILDLLHPTPAVCGLPKKKAMEFILDKEPYNRTFYSGFLGELNTNFEKKTNGSDLFVNLRCMQIQENQAKLYMGCGITQDSIPEKEWEESVNKSQTMKRGLGNR